MNRFPILFSLFSFLAAFVVSCKSDYRNMYTTSTDIECLAKQLPKRLSTSWYRTTVDVKGHHITGLLLIKEMPDSSYRVVFTGDAGIRFFDFSFSNSNLFSVEYAMKQLDKKVVIQALRTDFELLLGIPYRNKNVEALKLKTENYFAFTNKKETAYIVYDSVECKTLRLESSSRSVKKTTLQTFGSNSGSPDSVVIAHHTFDMTIRLSKIEKTDAPQE